MKWEEACLNEENEPERGGGEGGVTLGQAAVEKREG